MSKLLNCERIVKTRKNKQNIYLFRQIRMDARIEIHYRFRYTFFQRNKKNAKTCFLARMLDTIPYAMENQTKASHSFLLRQILPRIASVSLWLSVFCFDE